MSISGGDATKVIGPLMLQGYIPSHLSPPSVPSPGSVWDPLPGAAGCRALGKLDWEPAACSLQRAQHLHGARGVSVPDPYASCCSSPPTPGASRLLGTRCWHPGGPFALRPAPHTSYGTWGPQLLRAPRSPGPHLLPHVAPRVVGPRGAPVAGMTKEAPWLQAAVGPRHGPLLRLPCRCPLPRVAPVLGQI